MFTESENHILQTAKEILSRKLNTNDIFSNPKAVKRFCQLQFANLEREAFGVLFLNSKNQLIKFDKLFYGTVNEASVYPREVAKAALQHNAVSVIFTHNHPSGSVDASQADKMITERLVSALELFDISVLDHIIVSHTDTLSFAEKGLL